MSEEEIMKILKDKVELWDKQRHEYSFSEIVDEIDKENKAIQGLLDLYNKEKEEVKELKEKNEKLQNDKRGILVELYKANDEKDKKYISKYKIRKFIKNELPDDEICKCCNNYDVNGVKIKEDLKELLKE